MPQQEITKPNQTYMEGKLQGKLVQEISEDDIPESFVYKNGYPQCKIESVPYMDECVIDFSLVTSSSSSTEANHELEKLQLALTTWGCFQAINHGITKEFMDKVREVNKQFFALPLEEKQKYSRETSDYDGYGNDAVVSEQQTLDWMDRLFLTVYPQQKRKLKFWPEKPLEFREIIHEYTLKLKEMREQLLNVIARSLNLEENCFLKEYENLVTMTARFNFCPPCSTPEDVLGFKPHADSGFLTVILQDNEVEGLQVLKDDKWFKVPIVPDALFVNVGDSLEILSNGILKSPLHRVVTNTKRARISLAMFSDTEKEIGPISELITDERPQMYKRIQDYNNFFFEKYQLGKRILDVVRL